MDPRIEQLAETLISHSVKLQENENILIEVRGEGIPLAQALVRAAYAKGAHPFVRLTNPLIQREIMKGTTRERMEQMRNWDEPMWKDMHAFIAIVGGTNDYELSDIPAERLRVQGQTMKPLSDYIMNNVKWCGLNWPTTSMAQKAKMPTDVFQDFYFNVCMVDYEKMYQAFLPLQELMNRTDQVRLVGEGTDLTFSIKDIPSIICAGDKNIPDGEIYTAPVRDSVNGVISFNTTCSYRGLSFDNVRLTFKDGKIVEAYSSNDVAKLNEIFDTDEGARFIGEFAIAANPLILQPMNDILFDEKIAGSFHFTPGQAYDNAYNGNNSSIHWDMVNIQRPGYGGGEIWFDGVLIRQDGLFVLDELKGLNPENLMK